MTKTEAAKMVDLEYQVERLTRANRLQSKEIERLSGVVQFLLDQICFVLPTGKDWWDRWNTGEIVVPKSYQ